MEDRRTSWCPSSLFAGAIVRLPNESIAHWRLVEDPAGHAWRRLDLPGIPMDLAVLAPEGNARAVHTFSHEQVRRPINAASIGRWRNYEWASDGAWG